LTCAVAVRNSFGNFMIAWPAWPGQDSQDSRLQKCQSKPLPPHRKWATLPDLLHQSSQTGRWTTAFSVLMQIQRLTNSQEDVGAAHMAEHQGHEF